MLTRARLDAIVYRVGGVNPCYASEHECSMAKDKDFYRSLSKLRSQVISDLSAGSYSPGDLDYIRTFVTCVDTVLPLRDGSLKQSFLGCSYEALDHHGRREFISKCPTNYLSNEADALLDSLASLGEVIEARYLDECVNDLKRELPRAPLVTTFGLNGGEGRPAEVCAVIERNGGSFEAFSPGLSARARAGDPYEALQGLEHALSGDPSHAYGHVLYSDPIFGRIDVPLALKEPFSVKRFLVSVAPCKNGSRYYHAYAPQAGVAAKSASIEGALQDIGDTIALRFHGADAERVERALKARPILTTARLDRALS